LTQCRFRPWALRYFLPQPGGSLLQLGFESFMVLSEQFHLISERELPVAVARCNINRTQQGVPSGLQAGPRL
jgi:hypothetical protein